MAVLSPAPRGARPFADDLDVLAYLGQRLLDDPGLPRPRFGEDVWDLQAIAAIPAYRRIPASIRIDWTLIAQPVWRLCAKEVALALLQPLVGLEHRLPHARRSPLPAHDLMRQLSMWRGWFAWLAAHDVERLADVTQSHCDAWLAGRSVEVRRGGIQAEVIAIRRFADYGRLLSADGYRDGFRPWGAKTASQLAGAHPRQENRTPVIPDEIFGPLLAGALFLVRVAGPDVLAAQAECTGSSTLTANRRPSTSGWPATWPSSEERAGACPSCTSAISTTSGVGTSSTKTTHCTG